MLDKPAELLDRLEQSGLLTPSIIECRDALLGAESAEKAADELVRLKLLTEYQARVAVMDGSVPLSIGDYIVEDMIGRGGMGFVLKARHRRMKRQVAIKFLHKSMTESPDLVARFEREVEAAAKLHHQNIVTAYDAGEHDGSHYLVMQYVDGEDLSHHVKRDGPLRVSQAVDVIRQAAEGLGYAHEKGIVHRDIKPGNLLLDREDVVRILDMGLARMHPSPGDALDGGAHADLTNTGSVMGTIDYMAPEQALDAKSADFRADIYSLGCTLYFLLTGNPPFRSDTIMRRLLAHREQDVPLIRHIRPEVPRELDEVFAKMMAKKKEDRFPSMQHLVVALNSIELDDAEAEQMVTIDAAVHGAGGFISLPEGDHLDDSDAPSDFRDSSATKPTDSRVPATASAAAEATLIESDSQLSKTVVTEDVESLGHAEAVPDILVSPASPPASLQTGRGRSSLSWKVVIPGIATGVMVVILFALSQTGTDGPPTNGSLTDGGAQSESKANSAQSQETTNAAAKNSSPSAMSPDRRAAEWVLACGGGISVVAGNDTLQISDVDDLPAEPFLVVGVTARPAKGFRNAQEVKQYLSPLRGVRHLSVSARNLGDEALKVFGQFPELGNLSLRGGNFSDEGLLALSGLKKLQYLNLTLTDSFSEAGVQSLRDALPGCQITTDYGTLPGESSAPRDSTDFVLSFDGVDDFVECPALTINPNRPFTIEATARNWEDRYGVVCGWMGNVSIRVAKGNLLGAGITTTELPEGESHKLGAEIPDTDVLRLALTSDGKQIRMFVNGVEKMSRMNDHPISPIELVSGRFFCIGAHNVRRPTGLFGAFSGTIDEVRVSSTQRYSEQYVPAERLESDEHTVALYHFDEGCGNVLKDSSGNGHDGTIHGATWIQIDE